MNAHLKERISSNKEELQHAESALAVARERVTVLRRMCEEEKKRSEVDDAWEAEQVAIANATIEAARDIVKNSLDRIAELSEAVGDSDKVSKNHDKYCQLKSQIQKKAQTLNKEIAFYEKNDNCPTCSQKIADDFKRDAIEKGKTKAGEMEKAVTELADEIEVSKKRIDEIETVMNEIGVLNSIVMKKTNEIESTEKHIKTLTTKKAAPTTNTTQDLANAVLNQEEAVESKKDLIEEQHYLSLAGTLLKDSGIKSRIIKNYVPVINDTINKYLAQMNFFVNFQLDEEFNETIKSRHRDVFTYASFSEGEKKKIDIALLFAWRAIASMKNSITTNLLILDEILDGSLDDQAMEAFLDIMANTKTGTNTFVISHKPKEVLQDKFDRCVHFAKRGNFSRMF
jgi:chromosome segregation ATPase